MNAELIQLGQQLSATAEHYDKNLSYPVADSFPVMIRSNSTFRHMQLAGTKTAALGHDGSLLETNILLDLELPLGRQSNRRYVTDDYQNYNLELLRVYIKRLVSFAADRGTPLVGLRSKSLLRKPGVPASSTFGSFHIYGAAIDLSVDNMSARKLYDIIIDAVIEGHLPPGEYFLYPSFVHFSPSNVKDNCSNITRNKATVKYYGGRIANIK